jgi:hypothetical protein
LNNITNINSRRTTQTILTNSELSTWNGHRQQPQKWKSADDLDRGEGRCNIVSLIETHHKTLLSSFHGCGNGESEDILRHSHIFLGAATFTRLLLRHGGMQLPQSMMLILFTLDAYLFMYMLI